LNQIVLQLNKQGIVAPVAKSAASLIRTTAVSLFALEAAKGRPTPEVPGLPYQFHIDLSDVTPEEMHRICTSQLLSSGFHFLVRSLRDSLQEAYIYLGGLRFGGQTANLASIQEQIDRLRKEASDLNFPSLLEGVNRQLEKPIDFLAEWASLNSARNCLEHRRGIVGPRDFSSGEDVLRVRFPRLRLFYRHDGQEYELVPGHKVVAEARVMIGRASREVVFKSGEQIEFSQQDVFEIASACYLFAIDLAERLPVPTKRQP
jgi:hypothetical protein